MGYEGHVVGLADRAERVAKTSDAMAKLTAAHDAVGGDVVSAGGTGTFDINTVATEIQAGSYALMDTAYGDLQLPFRTALRVVATVVHVSPKYAVADCGLKALGMDHGNPTIEGGEVWFCSDEHVTFAMDPAPQVGDRVLVQPAHVDPTVAYHAWFHLADGPDARRRRDREVADRPAGLGRLKRYRARLMATELSHLDATAQAELVRNGDASPIELVEAAIARVEKLNGELNAVIHPLFERARTAAAGDLPDGPFRGVPIVIKDFDGTLAGAPYHAGNRALQARGLHRADDELLLREARTRRVRDHRQDEHSRVRADADGRTGVARPDAEPVGHRRAARADRAAGPRPRSRAAWCRSRTRATAAVRSASPRACAACSA